ncbi:uncharacterized protein [Primulina eburnea]|uniref:uncharacterized protein isoform X3 n=1 Tax=Primulina eburnea TaxID=1245227 RepID=UPI003C6CBE16
MLELRDGSCYPKEVVGVDIGLACVDGVIAIIAFYQMIRIHLRNSHLGWTRQKVFHLLIGTSNFGYLLYFGLTPLAACKDWLFWSQSCGFIIMAFPKILFVAAFLLLLSFWVDLCHQTNDDEEDEECSSREALLEKISKTDYSASSCCNFCTFRFIEIGSRQKVVILVTVLVTAIMVASSLLIWIGMGKNPIDAVVVAQVYVDLISISVLLLGIALACYGCWFGHCMCCQFYIECFCCSCYKYSCSSVPSAFILFEMRELPPPLTTKEQEESRTLAFISDGSVTTHPQHWITSTIVQNQVSRASPI